MLLVNSLDSLSKDVFETFKNAFEELGYKVTLLKDAEKLVSMKKEWSGHRWCFSGKIGGNATVASSCFQRDDLLLLRENQRVSCCILCTHKASDCRISSIDSRPSVGPHFNQVMPDMSTVIWLSRHVHQLWLPLDHVR